VVVGDALVLDGTRGARLAMTSTSHNNALKLTAAARAVRVARSVELAPAAAYGERYATFAGIR
jgi:hypothetical protein